MRYVRKDYGERTAAILQEFGDDGLKLAEKYGDDLARIIDNLEPTEAKKATKQALNCQNQQI